MLYPWQANANLVFNYSGNRKIEASIAASELNRIGIIGGEIVEVIGDENKYAVYWSGDWRNLFIKPKVEVGETIEVSLIMPGGHAQDIRFTALDMAPQTILLNLSDKTSRLLTANSEMMPQFDPQLKSAVAAMMRAMIDGVKDKYYVISAKRLLRKTKQQVVWQTKSYRYGDLSGAVLSVKNLDARPLKLAEEDFNNLFTNTIAINLATNWLAKGASSQLFIITRAVQHD
jgi:hypothetical protein